MKAELARGADIHGWAFAYGFHAAKNFDGIGSVFLRAISVYGGGFALRSGLAVFQFWFGSGLGKGSCFRCHSAPFKTRGPSSRQGAFLSAGLLIKLLKLYPLSGLSTQCLLYHIEARFGPLEQRKKGRYLFPQQARFQ